MDELKDILLQELQKVTVPLGIRIIELTCYSGKNGLHIRAVIDKYNGVTLNDCEQVTRLFNERLDILEVIDSDAYTLEISSPGLYRVFKRKEEYEAFRSRQVKVFLKEPLEQGPEAHRGRRELGGILMGLENDTVMLKTSEDTVEIPYRLVSKTKLDG